jgi:hypothetical protein
VGEKDVAGTVRQTGDAAVDGGAQVGVADVLTARQATVDDQGATVLAAMAEAAVED